MDDGDHLSDSSFDEQDWQAPITPDDDGLEYVSWDVSLATRQMEAEDRDEWRGDDDEDETMPWIV